MRTINKPQQIVSGVFEVVHGGATQNGAGYIIVKDSVTGLEYEMTFKSFFPKLLKNVKFTGQLQQLPSGARWKIL